MNLKKTLVNLGMFVLSVGLGLLLAEFVSRLVFNSSDFLQVELVKDDILGIVPSPSAIARFDKWGFRNRTVPETVDIVAVGDSHTYGNAARMVDSWPYVLSRLTGRNAYNMGVGGYGPNQYFYLTRTKALSLKPQMIIWGLYMGDDFENAFSITYGLNYWSKLRKLPIQHVDPYIWGGVAPGPASWDERVRTWLSRNSVLYQLIFHTGLGGRIKAGVQIKNAADMYPGVATSLIIPEKHILEAFRPMAMLSRLDQQNPNVREGMRITFELLKETNRICQENHTQFLVVVIPTKEMVFSDYLEHNSKLPLDDVIDKLLVNERSAREQTFQNLNESGIPYVDALTRLKKSVEEGLYASSAGDMHPNRNGYRVIAEAITDQIQRTETPR